MKKIFVLFLFLSASISAVARISYTTGRGQGSGFCSYSQSYFCMSRIKDSADRSAKSNAEWNCQMNQGRALTYTASCNSNCFPSTLSPRDQNTLVRCNSTCTVQCELQD